MPTLKQIEANRLNAQHSTGPRSEEGKRVSSQNAFKSGLDAETQFVIGESREDFAQLQTEWYHHHSPVNPEERLQVDTIVRSEWFLRRYFRVEAQLWEYHSMEAQRNTGVELGEAFSKASLIFMRFQRRINLAEKSGKEARAELDRLKALRQPQQTTTETQQLGSFLTKPIIPDRSDPEPVQNQPPEAATVIAIPPTPD